MYGWVIVGTLSYRRAVIEKETQNDYFDRLERQKAFTEARYKALSAQPGADPQELQSAEESLAMIYWESKMLPEALELMQKVVEHKASTTDDSKYNQPWIDSMLKLASIYRDLNNWDACENTYKTILEYDLKRLPDDDPKVARDYNNLGVFHFMKGTGQEDREERRANFSSAEDYLGKAIGIYRKANGEGSPAEGNCLWNLYLVLREQGRNKEARAVKATAEAIDKKQNRVCTAP